uniref:Uncharacterized protein n=1 Tax=Meloidogyne incognita TaxID=6306 RepID=A0A914P3H5_MELIC
MKAREFPIGHPTILTRETLLDSLPWTRPNDNVYKGLLLVRVVPPASIRGLPPLLGYRTHDGRLTFPLCAACADDRQQHQCHHSEKQRFMGDRLYPRGIEQGIGAGVQSNRRP